MDGYFSPFWMGAFTALAGILAWMLIFEIAFRRWQRRNGK